jgi:hypothetical protein
MASGAVVMIKEISDIDFTVHRKQEGHDSLLDYS